MLHTDSIRDGVTSRILANAIHPARPPILCDISIVGAAYMTVSLGSGYETFLSLSRIGRSRRMIAR
jgi:hypothetical protein